MAKRSKKRAIGYAEDHLGCIQGLINIFHFHHGRPSQKLLADKRHGSRRITGAAYTSNELDPPDGSWEMCKISKVTEPCETATSDKMSVKELMEEEMFEYNQQRQMNKSEEDPEQTASTQHGHGQKNRSRANKKSFDLSCDVNVTFEKPAHQKHKSLSSLDFGGMMAELCTQINVEDVGCLNHDQTSEEILGPSKDDDPSVMEGKLEEATKVFVSHFIDGKNFMKDGKIQPSGELMDALQILNSNRDAFVKILQDPNSRLVKHLQKLEDHQADKGDGQTLVEQEHAKNKHQSFFWRKLKGLDRSSSKKHENPQNVSTIIVLKPGPVSSQVSKLGNRVRSDRASTYFFFNEFTRKLKHAMRKKQPSSSNSDKAVVGEYLSMSSPSRDHFFIEKIPRKSTRTKKRDKASEAKKNLAEIVGTDGVNVDFLTISSPRNDMEHSLVTSPRKLSPGKAPETGDEITAQQVQEDINHDPCSVNSKSCIATEKIGDDVEVKNSDVSDECDPDEGDIEIIRPANADPDKRISSDTSCESCSPSTSKSELAEETSKSTKEEQTMCFNLENVEENEPSSPLTSTTVCSKTREVEDSNTITDRSDWTSPLSVLEPIFKEDDVSPSINSLPVAQLIQPRQIKFEDQISPSSLCLKTRVEERKSVFEFVKEVVRVSQLTRTELLDRFLFAEHLLDPSLFDEVDFLPDYRCYDPKLLFDLIEEVLTEVCGRDFDGISSFSKPCIRLKLKKGKGIVDEIWEGVSWYLQPEIMECTLDQTVAKDLSKCSTWMDLRVDCESIGSELEEEIWEELIEDAILSCTSLIHGAESGEVESSLQM